MTKSLSQFAHMSENYALMKEAESSLLMLRQSLRGMQFYKINSGDRSLSH